MTAVCEVNARPALSMVPEQPTGVPGRATTATRRPRPVLTEAMIMACVLAEKGLPHRLGAGAEPEYVHRVLFENLPPDHATVLRWRERLEPVVGTDPIALMSLWSGACAAVRACYPMLSSAWTLPAYGEATFTLPA